MMKVSRHDTGACHDATIGGWLVCKACHDATMACHGATMACHGATIACHDATNCIVTDCQDDIFLTYPELP